ncbi:MAG: hypothetical protein ACRDYA_22990 [Egibacteraceae bacterium]
MRRSSISTATARSRDQPLASRLCGAHRSARAVADFFGRRPVNERGASARTIASYRDTFALLLRYAAQRTGRTPSQLRLDDLDSPLILDFLDHTGARVSKAIGLRIADVLIARPSGTCTATDVRSAPSLASRGMTGYDGPR